MTTVAFLGTGTMGFPMARNLLAAGFQIRAWNRTRERAEPLRDAGAEVFEEPGDAARGAELIVTMLSDAVAVIDTAAAALDAADEGLSWLQMSTIGLEGTDRCAELAEHAGVALVDSPVLGTREPAQKGELIVLASGPESQHERCQPVFDAVGKRTVWLGEAGSGTRLKVAVNSWIVGVVGVLAETIALSQTLGVDPERFFEAVEGGPLDLPYARLKGKAMIERTFDDPAFRLALARKDADLVLAAASAHGLDLRIMEAVAQRMRAAERDGHGDEDMAATYWAGAPERLGVM
jgi:3-hydroxyisobutyrate dehydrogenase